MNDTDTLTFTALTPEQEAAFAAYRDAKWAFADALTRIIPQDDHAAHNKAQMMLSTLFYVVRDSIHAQGNKT